MEQLALASRLLDAHATPLVRRLLFLGELWRQNNGPANNPADEASTGAHNVNDGGAELERLRQERQLLVLLRVALHNAEEALTVGGENGNGEAHGDRQSDERRTVAAHKIGRQLSGAAVPLFAILQRPHRHIPQPSSNEDCGRTHLIVRSAEHACTEEAARALQAVGRVRRRAVAGLYSDNNCCTEENGAGVDGAPVDDGIKTLVLPALISCAVALSSLDITEEDDKDSGSNFPGGAGRADGDQTDDAEKKSADEVNRINEPALDRGEDCAAAILACVRSFVSPGEDSHRSPEELPSIPNTEGKGSAEPASPLAKAVGSAMGGALVARLVQGCLSLLPGGDTQSKNNEKAVHRSENAALQLEALAALHSLLTGVPSSDLWRSMLPGCFAGLYRAAVATLRYASMASSSRVGAGCVGCVALLLRQSLSYGPSEENKGEASAMANDEVQSIANSLMAAVRMSEQPARVDEASVPGEASPEDKGRAEMKMEVNQRLPAPLSVLLSLLTANRSIAVRKSGLHLCRAILVDAHSVWSGTNAKALSRKTLEYCLAVLCDGDKELSRCSRDTLRLYKAHLGPSGWKQLLGQSVAPAVLELVESLPAFAKSGRESEVCNHLRRIDGYLLVSFRGTDDNFDVQECLKGKRKSDIGPALGCTEAAEVLTRAFSALFAPDANSISSGPLIESGSTTDPNALVLFRRDNSCRFLYLRDDAAMAAKSTVNLLARSLGAKRCAYAIDACVAEVFESCSRSNNGHFSTNGGLSQRTHWPGVCVFATELLRGLGEAKDLSKSHLRILSSLASSVLPAIVADPLWTLPTVFESNASRGAEQSSSFSNGGAPSVAVMHSNAILVSSLMGLIAQFAHSLGSDIGLHLPTILLPILERASPVGNHSSVQRAAFSLLWEISLGTGCKDVSSLLASNVDYLTDAISLRLRKHVREQSRMGRSLLGVVDVILRSLVYSKESSSSEGSGDSSSVVAHVATVVHMLDRLLDHFDRQAHMTAFALFDTAGVFRSMCSFMDESVDAYIVDSNGKDSMPPSPRQEQDEWFNRLDFELNVKSGGNEEGPDAFDEPSTDQEAGPPEVLRAETKDDETNAVLSSEIEAINSILKRCCYLLGYSDLRIQTICCDTILCGFRALGMVGSFRRSTHGISSSNPLLPSIAEFWPSIVAQLRTASASLASVNRISRLDLSLRHAMAADQEKGPSKAGLEHLIAQLLQIVSELCASSDGFFVDRFENDAFPILAGLVQDCHSSPPIAQQKHTLLLSILECFQRTFESSCGSGLAHLIPAVGTMLFPMLAYDDPVGEAALTAVKAMLAVDSDGLWRGLHKLSGQAFPCNPLGSDKGGPCPKSIVAVAEDRHDRTLSQRAGALLDFADRLPDEQPV